METVTKSQGLQENVVCRKVNAAISKDEQPELTKRQKLIEKAIKNLLELTVIMRPIFNQMNSRCLFEILQDIHKVLECIST